MQDKDTLSFQLTRLEQDRINIQAGMAKFRKEIEDAQLEIQTLSQNVERHQGALNYNNLLIDSIKKQIEEIEKANSN